MPILPQDHAARLLEYYIRFLVERAGLRWTAANTADFDLLGELLAQIEVAPELDSIPPFGRPIVPDRVTQVFERDVVADAAEIARAGRQRYDEADDVPVRRILRREGYAR